MKKALVVVDMQNDFVTGCLGTKEAQDIVPALVDFVKSFDGDIYFTQDTHDLHYLNTQEGRRLPVEHCLENTPGWEIIPELNDLIYNYNLFGYRESNVFRKDTFGSYLLGEKFGNRHFFPFYDEIHFVGVCTGICVISNAVVAKTANPEARIVIHKDLCACVTPETHETALNAMKTLQMDIV